VTFRVRPFRESDYTALARIKRTAEREPVTAEELRERDARWNYGRYEKVRAVGVDEEDAPIGYGEIYHEPSRFEPRRYFLRLAVDPRLRRQGIGAAVWMHLAAELDERSALVACLWADDGTACRDFIVRRGFIEVIRSYEQVVALATAPHPHGQAEERLTKSGISIETLAALCVRDEANALRRAHELYTAARLDQPTLGRVTAEPFADWRRRVVDAPDALLQATFVALDGDHHVGCSAVHRESDDVLRMQITAVLPEYRRRGIARALKLRVHAWARANGYREIHTSTSASNVGMVSLNTALGYAIVASWGGYELRFTR
jgi:ribosomal protein S18 acetylase RimI-like enzyme